MPTIQYRTTFNTREIGIIRSTIKEFAEDHPELEARIDEKKNQGKAGKTTGTPEIYVHTRFYKVRFAPAHVLHRKRVNACIANIYSLGDRTYTMDRTVSTQRVKLSDIVYRTLVIVRDLTDFAYDAHNS